MQQLNPSEITDIIRQRIEGLDVRAEVRNEGVIVGVSDGIVRIHGLADAQYGEMIEFPGSLYGMALNLERDSVGAVILGDYLNLSEGMTAHCTGRILEVPVGRELLGRVVDSLGAPIDGKGPINTAQAAPIEKVAPGVIARQSVDQPVQIGLKCIDAMVPVGRGSGNSSSVIGRSAKPPSPSMPSSTRRTAALSASMWPSARRCPPSPTSCAPSRSTASWATPSSLPPAPRTRRPCSSSPPTPAAPWGSFLGTKAKTPLIIYDDLTKQAWAYRQISLLLRRPPGREAYPGDVFYLHSRLLERGVPGSTPNMWRRSPRAGCRAKPAPSPPCRSSKPRPGTSPPFVPTNVISITDGQIFWRRTTSTPACARP